MTFLEPPLEDGDDALAVLLAARVSAHQESPQPMWTLEDACARLGIDYDELVLEAEQEGRAS